MDIVAVDEDALVVSAEAERDTNCGMPDRIFELAISDGHVGPALEIQQPIGSDCIRGLVAVEREVADCDERRGRIVDDARQVRAASLTEPADADSSTTKANPAP